MPTLDVREAEKRYESLVELSPDGILLRDEERRIVFANRALVRMLEASDAGDLVGKDVLDFIHPEEHAVVKERIAAMARGEAVPWLEQNWLRLDGTTFPAEVAAVPTQKDGRLVVHVFVRDLTEKKRAQSEVEENQRRLKALFDTALDAIVFHDSEGNVVDANPAARELLGRTHEELIRAKVGDFATSDDNRQAALRGWSKMRTTGHNSGEFTVVRKDGTTREIEYRAVGNAPGLDFSIMRDVSARKEAERALRQLSGKLLQSQDEERGRIARQLHETTGQSLIAVKLNLDRVRRSHLSSDPDARVAIEESLALTEQSINEIRTLSYLLRPPMIEEVGLVPSLQWFARGFEHRTGIRIVMTADDDLGEIPESLKTAIYRIVQEALTNVQRHSGSSSASVFLERRGDRAELIVEDHGRGMSEELRGQPIGLMATAGVGIAGMHERVKELGGTMQLHSDDSGTKVTVSIPIGEA